MEENLKQQSTNIIKIAMFGPESTGKTTLASQLASHFKTVWIPEFARQYLQNKWDLTKAVCEERDLLVIAEGQVLLENEGLRTANTYLFCDTNLMVTKVFSEMNYGGCNPVIDKAARKHSYDLFFLTAIDVPLEKDDLRDVDADRTNAFSVFEQALIEGDKPYIILSGNQQQRLEKAIAIVDSYTIAKKMGFSSFDFIQIYLHGIQIEKIGQHLDIFRHGVPKTILERPARIGDGVLELSEQDFYRYSEYFDSRKGNLTLKKFIPASGAATRMFQFLAEFLNEFQIGEESINAFINRKNATSLAVFLAGIEKFPFYDAVIFELQKKYSNYKSWTKDLKHFYFIKMLLSKKHFDFSNKPKGVLPFHKYDSHIATSLEEHLNESCLYASSAQQTNLHFTVTESHRQDFSAIIDVVKAKIVQRYNCKINVDFSYQHSETDTIAVDPKNIPLRDENGKLVFRPAGHGALIENLNKLEEDVIFIKNIDNVIQNHIDDIALYKKALAGVLIEVQHRAFEYLKQIEEDKIAVADIEAIVGFVNNKLNKEVSEDFYKYTLPNQISELKAILDRPIRVCGMVKNEGEPGGGPFWVSDKKGNVTLQIVESSQVDLRISEQAQILRGATHFNPVDLVCGVRDYRGEKFDLTQFVDKNGGFIVEKSKKGQLLRSYELPGLWNGGMSKWITLFVQVPLITFSPVKTVNDLLKPAHQPQ